MNIGGAVGATPLLSAKCRRVVILRALASRIKSLSRVHLLVAIIGHVSSRVPGCGRLVTLGTLYIVLDSVRRLLVEKLYKVTRLGKTPYRLVRRCIRLTVRVSRCTGSVLWVSLFIVQRSIVARQLVVVNRSVMGLFL